MPVCSRIRASRTWSRTTACTRGRSRTIRHYSREYWTHNINLESAWDITTGSPNVIVAVVDAGVYRDHPDLAGRLLPGMNFLDNSTDTTDDSASQHGTIVTLLAAAKGNDGVGQAGVAWNAKILPIKVINSDGDGNSGVVANGIHWAVDHGATVINLSLGGPDFSQSVSREIGYARARNVTVVAAAGNAPNERDYPADDPNVITIGASDQNDKYADFTSVVDKVDIPAPGAKSIAMALFVDISIRQGIKIRQRSIAVSTARVRSRTPSFDRMLEAWFFTVPSAAPSASAISRLEYPPAIKRSTSSSRAVSGEAGLVRSRGAPSSPRSTRSVS